jgi:tRNA(fMet)-specific endonuclease VapC
VICLDTNVVIEAINHRKPEMRERLGLAWAGGEVIGLPAVLLYEL